MLLIKIIILVPTLVLITVARVRINMAILSKKRIDYDEMSEVTGKWVRNDEDLRESNELTSLVIISAFAVFMIKNKDPQRSTKIRSNVLAVFTILLIVLMVVL